MKILIWFILAVSLLEVLSMAIALAKRDFERKPITMAVTIIVNAVLAAWAAFVLGA